MNETNIHPHVVLLAEIAHGFQTYRGCKKRSIELVLAYTASTHFDWEGGLERQGKIDAVCEEGAENVTRFLEAIAIFGEKYKKVIENRPDWIDNPGKDNVVLKIRFNLEVSALLVIPLEMYLLYYPGLEDEDGNEIEADEFLELVAMDRFGQWYLMGRTDN